MMRKPTLKSLLSCALVLAALLWAGTATAQRRAKAPPGSERPKKSQIQKRNGKIWNSQTQKWEYVDDDWRKQAAEYRYDPKKWKKSKYRSRVKARIKHKPKGKGKEKKSKEKKSSEKK